MGSNANDTLKTVNEMKNHHLSFARYVYVHVQGLTGTTSTLILNGEYIFLPIEQFVFV